MVRAVDRERRGLMAGQRDFESSSAAGYTPLVVQLVGVTGNLQDAEDVVREAFARAAVRWRRLSGYAAPEAWVRRVACNLAVSAARRSRRFLAAAARVGPPQEVPGLSADELDLVAALGRVWFEDGTALQAGGDGGFTTEFEIPPARSATSSSTPTVAGGPRR